MLRCFAVQRHAACQGTTPTLHRGKCKRQAYTSRADKQQSERVQKATHALIQAPHRGDHSLAGGRPPGALLPGPGARGGAGGRRGRRPDLHRLQRARPPAGGADAGGRRGRRRRGDPQARLAKPASPRTLVAGRFSRESASPPQAMYKFPPPQSAQSAQSARCSPVCKIQPVQTYS